MLRRLRRPLEFVLSCVALVVLSPLIFLGLVVSAVSLRAWPVYTQQRVGCGGSTFVIFKLRTLPRDVPQALTKYDLGAVTIPTGALWLRRTHLDESLQLLNVVGGSMSLVGPRPELVELVDRMKPAHRRIRHTVRPGITGLWQISVASERLLCEDPMYDTAYVRARSLLLDARILWRTVTITIGTGEPIDESGIDRFGAVGSDDVGVDRPDAA